jgi:hypothetical protein
LSIYGDRLPEGQVGGGTGARSGELGGRGLVDLGGFSLRDLRDLSDDDESYLARALSRVLGPAEADGYHGFSSKI